MLSQIKPQAPILGLDMLSHMNGLYLKLRRTTRFINTTRLSGLSEPTPIKSLNLLHVAELLKELGCGLSIVVSTIVLPYPGLLARPQAPFGDLLGHSGFRSFPQFEGVASREERLAFVSASPGTTTNPFGLL